MMLSHRSSMFLRPMLGRVFENGGTMMKRFLTIFLTLVLLLGLFALPAGASSATLDTAAKKAAACAVSSVPHPGAGDDWAVIGAVRGGFDIPEHWTDSYYRAIAARLQETNGVLSKTRLTEYARVILGLTAIGENPRNVAGYNLLAPLADYDAATQPGVTSAAYVLLALDCGNYKIPTVEEGKTQATRPMYVDFMLGRQLSDGGWAIGSEEADPDVTAMVLQALAPYQESTPVKNAVTLGVNRLSTLQNDDGGYSSWGYTSSESCSQVVLTLCALGISMDDSRFVKNGKSVLDKLLTYQLSDGSFCHDDSFDAYATMQALCALTAAVRQAGGKSAFFTMTDVQKMTHTPQSGVTAHTSRLAETPAFTDTKGIAAQQAIETLAAYGVLNGMTKTTFEPAANLTRAQFAKIVVGALNLTPEYRGTFKDVAQSAWYAPYVDTAAAYGIVNGVGDGKFNSDGAITVQEAAAMTARAASLCGMDPVVEHPDTVLRAYTDASRVSSWARSSMAYCAASGLWARGVSALTPTRQITRGEIAQMLCGLLLSANLLHRAAHRAALSFVRTNTFSREVRRGRCPHRPIGQYEFAGDFR